ncbi:LicD family protein [Halopelagius fulvigenes]|uniref:LicD family protein n=1 Tax=Halopelagius fulvigenes TaxID=1198324 RepID=A0ABD5U2Y0_9EURY
MDEQLAWVTELFDSNDVTHWVESGTLLTLVRSGELTKYDDDIDVAILASDVEKVDRLIPEIEEQGYRVQSRSYHGRTYKYQFIPTNEKGPRSRTNRRLVDVMVFRRNETHAWTAQSQVKEEFDTPGLGELVDVVYPLVQQYARSAGGEIEMTSFPKRQLLEMFTLWLPRKYVDDIVYDEELGVHTPAAVEDYLAFRYGDWRTPVSEWSLTDDGAIRQAEPLELVVTARQ